jgi:4-hydroxybenzoate polyprenyltransferase
MTSIPQSFHPSATLPEKIQALLKLTRWREHVPFTIPLTICGALLAVSLNQLPLDWRLLGVTIANIFAMSFAFMINDVIDAPDDALVPRKRARNPISNGTLSYREGALVSWLTFAIALGLYAFGGIWAFGLGALVLVVCYLYSVPPFRLKARPITDVTSHIFMLSGGLIMVGYFTYHTAPGVAWAVIAAMMLFSAYGQFFNQIDDYEADKAAGLRNTVVLLGKFPTMLLMYGSAIGAFLCMLSAILLGAFPTWLGSVLLMGAFISFMFPWETDMRGNPADFTTIIQKPLLFTANMAALAWLAHFLGYIG